MNHICKIIFIAISLMATIPCFAEEPNIPVNIDYNAIEARITSLEKRLDALEKRIYRIELQRIPAPAEPNKDSLRIERLNKQIEDLNNAITLDEIRENIPAKHSSVAVSKKRSSVPYSVNINNFSKEDIPEVLNILNAAKGKVRLLSQQERNYKTILELADKYSDLAVNVPEMKRRLHACRNRSKKADEDLKDIRESIERHRYLFNIVPQ